MPAEMNDGHRGLFLRPDVARAIEEFTRSRDWSQFHTPKNLATALVAEAGELAAVFQWLDGPESESVALSPDRRRAVEDELADVSIYLYLLTERLGVDLNDLIERKLHRNERRFPPPHAAGRHDS